VDEPRGGVAPGGGQAGAALDRELHAPTLIWPDEDPGPGSAPTVELRGAHAGSVTDAVLRAVSEGLGDHGLEHFLIARGRSGSRVGVPADRVSDLTSALRQLGEPVPLAARIEVADGSPWTGPLVHLPSLQTLEDIVELRIFAQVRDPVSGLELGRAQGCSLELWSTTPTGGLRAPRWNPITAEVTAADRARPGARTFPGVVVRSIPPFTHRHVFEAAFPIDAVVTWVDGDDAEWRGRRQRRLEELGLVADDDAADDRFFRDHGELRYLFRSLERYAPWLRRVYLVTAGQRPDWLVADHPWLRLVDHEEIIEPTALPVFSSRPIAARFHRIPDLSEHFLYFNDDVLLGRRVEPELFFTASGLTRFFLSRAQVPREPSDVSHLGGRQVVQRLLHGSFGVHLSRTFRHTPYALTRRIYGRMEERFGDELTATVHRPFRTPDDLIPEWMAHYLGYLEGTALPSEISYGYFRVGSRAAMERLAELPTNRKLDCFVLNDVGYEDLPHEEARESLQEALEKLLPGRGSFERP
jgi:hypothetical protein